MLSDTVVVPDSKLAGSVVTNFSLSRSELGITVEVGVDYGSDLEKFKPITLQVTRQVKNRGAGAASEFEPYVRFHSFADSSINFKVWLGGRNYVARLILKHELSKCFHSRYKQ
jgi:small-conductance mechanosensitive channel